MRPCYHKSSRRSSTGHCYTTNTRLAANEQALGRPKPLIPHNHGLVMAWTASDGLLTGPLKRMRMRSVAKRITRFWPCGRLISTAFGSSLLVSVQAASARYPVTKVHANFLDSPVPHEINCHISPPLLLPCCRYGCPGRLQGFDDFGPLYCL